MGIWVFKSFSPHHLCLLTMKRSPKNSHIQKLGMNNHHKSSSMSMRKKQNAEVKTKAQKKKARLQFYNITNRTTPKRRRRKHPTTKEVSSFSQVFSLNEKKKKIQREQKQIVIQTNSCSNPQIKMQADDDDDVAASSSSFALASWSIANLCFILFVFSLFFLLTKPVEHLLVDASTRLLQLTKMGLFDDARFPYITLERSQLFNPPRKEVNFQYIFLKSSTFNRKKKQNFHTLG